MTGIEAARTRRVSAPWRRARIAACVGLLVCWGAPGGLLAAPATQAPADLRRTVVELGDFDYAVRMEASRRIRRLDPEVAVPLLVDAATGHQDSYVQFRAAVLLSGFEGSHAREWFRQALDAPNDRVRAAAYEALEHDPDPLLGPRLLAALERETSEFVRPALLRALAAHDDDPAVREQLVQDIDRGEGVFRATVIEALGERGAVYAVEPLMGIASGAGALRDDALVALGRIGDRRARRVIAVAQAEAADTLQPIVSAAACLLGIDCTRQASYVMQALEHGSRSGGGEQLLLRAAASAAAALAEAGHADVLDALIANGVEAVDPARAPLALALGSVALRNPARLLAALSVREDLESALLLLRDAFDMLDEDLAEERFYVLLRSIYWDQSQDPRARAAAESAMGILEF